MTKTFLSKTMKIKLKKYGFKSWKLKTTLETKNKFIYQKQFETIRILFENSLQAKKSLSWGKPIQKVFVIKIGTEFKTLLRSVNWTNSEASITLPYKTI